MDGPCPNTEPHESHLYEPDDTPPGLAFAAICPGVTPTSVHTCPCGHDEGNFPCEVGTAGEGCGT